MSRSGYIDDYDDEPWRLICWRGAVASAIRGKRGQKLLRELLAALDAMPVKRLIAHELVENGGVCALGALGQARGMKLDKIDPDEPTAVAAAFDASEALVREIVYWNDDGFDFRGDKAAEMRWKRMRMWVAEQIKA